MEERVGELEGRETKEEAGGKANARDRGPSLGGDSQEWRKGDRCKICKGGRIDRIW